MTQPQGRGATEGRSGLVGFLTFALLAWALAQIVASATPSIARAMGWTSTSVVGGWSDGGPSSGRQSAGEPVERGIARSLRELEDDPTPPAPLTREITIERASTLREQPTDSAKIAARLPAGARVLLLQEEPSWSLVAYRSIDGLVIGWLSREDSRRP